MINFTFDSTNNVVTCSFQIERVDSVAANDVAKQIANYLEDFLRENTHLTDKIFVIFDLEKVSYISSLFLRIIGQTARKVPKGNLSVSNANQFIRDLFRTSGMEKVLSVVESDCDHTSESSIAPPAEFVSTSRLSSKEEYERIHKESLENPDKFWSEQAREHLVWEKPFEQVTSWENNYARWFDGGKLNACFNCVDKHLGTNKADKHALIWEGEPCSENSSPEIRKITYAELHAMVMKFANVLKNNGAEKGDRVLLYMPMIPEAVVAMLACARIGAPHSVVFAGFSPQAIAERIEDCQAKIVLTVDGGYRRGKLLKLKENVDEALLIQNENGETQAKCVEKVIVHKHTGCDVKMNDEREVWWGDELDKAEVECTPETMESEDILFVLYTSGSTGKPKGIVHSTAGYLLGTKLTHEYVFDLKDDDIYWCTADIGWITGHSYIVYGPLANGATVFMYEGAPDYPNPGRFWEIIERHKVTIFYTAPTAVRAFMKWGDEWPAKSDLSSLRLLGTVGEPINPNAWEWFYKNIGLERCPIVDTWWQTETGAIMITSLPGAFSMKPGSAAFPFFGVDTHVTTETGEPLEKGKNGILVIDKPWPSMLRGLWNDPDRYQNTYWSDVSGKYCTGDGARQDKQGYFWIIGRVDDVINVSGHRIGTAEVESALVGHHLVAEAAAVGCPDDLKGAILIVFATLMPNATVSEELQKELCQHVAAEVGAVAKPQEIRFIDTLPKTRSGKIMRRFLKQIAAGTEVTGDVSTLEDLGSLVKLMN